MAKPAANVPPLTKSAAGMTVVATSIGTTVAANLSLGACEKGGVGLSTLDK